MIKLKHIIPAVLLAIIMNSALANQITLLNTSNGVKTLSVTYQVAHKNKGGAALLGNLRRITLQRGAVIDVKLKGYQYAGIVPLSINGHRLPSAVTQFTKPHTCSAATSKARQNVILAFNLQTFANGHGRLSCEKKRV